MSVQRGIFAEQPVGVPPTGLKRLARVAGVFYFAVGVTGGFSEIVNIRSANSSATPPATGICAADG